MRRLRHGREAGGMDCFVLHFALLFFLFNRLFFLCFGTPKACEGEGRVAPVFCT